MEEVAAQLVTPVYFALIAILMINILFNVAISLLRFVWSVVNG